MIVHMCCRTLSASCVVAGLTITAAQLYSFLRPAHTFLNSNKSTNPQIRKSDGARPARPARPPAGCRLQDAVVPRGPLFRRAGRRMRHARQASSTRISSTFDPTTSIPSEGARYLIVRHLSRGRTTMGCEKPWPLTLPPHRDRGRRSCHASRSYDHWYLSICRHTSTDIF